MSATPSATRPNLTAEPSVRRMAPGRAAIKASVLASPCERLTATIQGSPGGGRRRVWMAVAAAPDKPPNRQPLGAAADQPAPDQAERRRADDPQQRRPVGDQSEIDREFVAAGDKFLGAVQGVDQEEAAAERQACEAVALLGDGRNSRQQPRQALADEAVGGEVRLRYRRSVELAVDFHGVAIDGHDRRARPDHEIGQGRHQRGRGVTLDHGC